MNEVDYIIITILLISVLIGVMRGFLKEILKLINLAGASYGSLYFRNYLSSILGINVSEFIPRIIFSILIWICIFIGGNVIIYLFLKLISLKGIIKVIDKSLGIVYGFIRCIAICLIVVYLIEKNSLLINEKVWQNSLLVNSTKTLLSSLEKYIPDTWKNKINEFSNIDFVKH